MCPNTKFIFSQIKRAFVYSFAITAIAVSIGIAKLPKPTGSDEGGKSRNSIIFISDTQKPMWFEKLFVKTHENEKANDILLNSICKDSTVSTVFFLGDVTSMASINGNWSRIDTFLSFLNSRHIAYHATAGNHEYLLSSTDGEKNFRKRFPDFVRTGYTVRIGPLAMVYLNSNFRELNHDEEIKQLDWYTKELQTLDQDPTIKIVAVGSHHPPYSNSSIVGHSEKVREQFVPPFIHSKKCRIFFSGHAHTFQHFKDTVTNKDFLVIGGGGGLLHRLKSGDPDELQDQVHWDSDYRMFHYVRGIFTQNGFLLTVMMLTEDLRGPYPVYQLNIPLKN
jgi:hypothetical protein